MDPLTLTALITAIGTQAVAVIRAAQGQRALRNSIGEQNGMGTVHEALHTIDTKLDAQAASLTAMEDRVSKIELKVY